jgi:hypothetical protein
MSFYNQISNYDPREVDLFLNGVAVTGFADQTFITVRYSSDKNTIREGAKGDVTFIKIASNAGELEFRLKQNSDAHMALLLQMNEDDALIGGVAAIPFVITRGSLPVASGMYKIGRAPQRTFMGSSDNRDEPVCEWMLRVANLKITG